MYAPIYNTVVIPKIIIWEGEERQKLLNHLGLIQTDILEIDSDSQGLLVDDFRHFINKAIETLQGRPNYKLVIWSAELLSWESQAVLLKPLEEMKENMAVFLIVATESLLAETILSRCLIEKIAGEVKETENYWPRVLASWKGSPADCLELADTIEKGEALAFCKEVIKNLDESLAVEVSDKRVKLTEETLDLAKDLRIRNINVKLAVADYLLRAWEIIKS